MHKDHKFLETWRKRQKLGVFKYSIQFGVLLWGIPTGVLFYFLSNFIHNYPATPHKLIKDIVIFSLAGGLFYGPLTWYLSEKKYFKLQNRDLRINHLINN